MIKDWKDKNMYKDRELYSILCNGLYGEKKKILKNSG